MDVLREDFQHEGGRMSTELPEEEFLLSRGPRTMTDVFSNNMASR